MQLSKLNPQKISNIFKIHKSWIDIEPETLWTFIEDEIGTKVKGKELPRKLKDMILAIRLCFASPRPYQEWEIFENTALAINEEVPIVDEMQELYLPEVALAASVMGEISPSKWSDEVITYMACIAHKDGFIVMPNSMMFVQSELNRISKSSPQDRESVVSCYAKHKISDTKPVVNDNDFVSVSCGKLWDVEQYIKSTIGS